MTNKAKTIFRSKERNVHFQSIFTPPKQFSFSLQQLQYLIVKCAEFFINTIFYNKNSQSPWIAIRQNMYACVMYFYQYIYIYIWNIRTVLLLGAGFYSETEPDDNCRYYLYNYEVDNTNEPWKFLKVAGIHSIASVWEKFLVPVLCTSKSLQNKYKNLDC